MVTSASHIGEFLEVPVREVFEDRGARAQHCMPLSQVLWLAEYYADNKSPATSDDETNILGQVASNSNVNSQNSLN